MSGVKVDTIHPGSLTEIPSFDIVTQAISMLCKKRECVSSNSFLYIKLSFRVFGLKELLKYIPSVFKNKLLWLSECKHISGNLMKTLNSASQTTNHH